MKENIKTLVALACLAALTACGGGGGGGSTGTPTTPVTPPVVVTPPAEPDPTTVPGSTLVTSVPTPSYTGSEELAAFKLLNAERQRCGFGLLKQNTKLDASAKGHADWLLVNGYTGHYQVTGTQLFTGLTPKDRMVAAGYGGGAAFNDSEVESDGNGSKIDEGTTKVRKLLNAPYHLMAMIRGFRDVGISVREKFDVGLTPNTRHVVDINFGHIDSVGPQSAAPGVVRTYPCEGSTGIAPLLNSETPSPVPSRNLRAEPLGSVVMVVGDVGKVLTITSASMTNTTSGAAVVLRAPSTKVNDPNPNQLYSNEGYVQPDAPLEPMTTYKVTIAGKNNGTAFTKTFSFTTGE